MDNENIKKINTIRVEKNNTDIKNFDDTIVVEHKLKLIINERIERNVICYNTSIKQFIYGHLYTEGYIKKISDVISFDLNQNNSLANIKLSSECDNNIINKIQNVNIVTTGYSYVEDNNTENNNIKIIHFLNKLINYDILNITNYFYNERRV